VAHTQEEVNPIITITDLEREISELRKALDDEHNDALLTNERLEEALKAKEGQMQDLRDEEGAKVARLTAEVAELVGARTRLEEHVAALEREQRSRRTASNEETEALRQQVASVEAQRVEAEAKAAALTAKVTALSSERERVKLQLELERDMNRRPMTGTTVRETALQKDLDIARRAVAELEADVAEAAARVADLEQTNEALTRNLEQSRLDGLGVNDLNWQRAVQLEDINRQLKKALDEALTSNGHHIIATSNHGEHVTALREENAALKAQNQQLTQALNDAGAAAARAADPAAPAVEQKTGESLGEEDGVAVTQLRAQLAALEQQNRRLRDALADAVASGGRPAVSTAAVAATNAADVVALRRSLAEADSRNHELAAATARAEEAATALKTELAARNEELQALSAAMDETKQENDDLSMKLESIGYGKIGAPAQQAAGPRGIAGPAAASGTFAHKAQ
jgi:DNA repair exonuclease SbcCD ATPase subunit